jgi:hypothetical protein
LPPAKPAQRADIAVEVDGVLDDAGNYTGEWIDSDGFEAVRLVYTFTDFQPMVGLEESIDKEGTAVLVPRPQQYPPGSTVAITSRYFRLVADEGKPGSVFRASVRRAS